MTAPDGKVMLYGLELRAALERVLPLAEQQVNLMRDLSDGAVGMSEDLKAVQDARKLLDELK